MPKKLIKKSTINKLSNFFFPKPKKQVSSNAESNFVNSFFGKTSDTAQYKIATQRGESPFITLEDGNINVEVWSTTNSRRLMGELYKKYHTEKITLTLTPACKYQMEQKWPEPPFVNVNLFNSQETEQDNWIGYIEFQEPDNIDFEGIIKKHGNVNVWASIHRKDGRYIALLHLSDKYKPAKEKVVETYSSHDESQIKILTDLSVETGKNYIEVDIEQSKDQKHYNFIYNGHIIGSATTQKIDKCLAGQKIDKAYLRIAKFRFQDEWDNKHYSPLVIQTK